MTRDEFEAKRSENIGRLQEMQEAAKARNDEYAAKENHSGLEKAVHLLGSFVGALAKSAERTMKNMKY